MNRLPIDSRPALGAPSEPERGTGALARSFCDALCLGDSVAADRIIEEALGAGLRPAAVQSFVITPAMERVGELWASRHVTVADEHLATMVSQRALVRLFQVMVAGSGRPRSREQVVLAAVQGQHHVLGLRMVADVLEAAGYAVLFLGEDVPVRDLRAFVAERQPAVVGLTVGLDSGARFLADSLHAVHEVAPDTRIMLGGRGIPPSLCDIGYPRVANTVEVEAVVQALLAGGPQALPAAVDRLRSPVLNGDGTESGSGESTAERLARSVDEAHSLAREHVRVAETFRDLAHRDSLTDLANRRGFDDRLRGLTADPTAGNGALLTLDVDAFKAINDERGHPVGDQVLVSIGRIIRESIRPIDTAARIGGDEFAVLMPRASVALAEDVGDRIRAAVADTVEPPVSVSFGAAEVRGDARSAVVAADSALYDAKLFGRDRVSSARKRLPPEPPSRAAVPPNPDAVSHSAVVVTDVDLRVAYVEGERFERHENDAGWWQGMHLTSVLASEPMEVLEPRWVAAAAGEPQAFTHQSADGSSIYRVQLTPIRDSAGDRVVSVLGTMQDQTERLRVTAELDRSEARLNESERLVGVGSWELDLATEVITYSRGVARLLGIAPEIKLDLVTYAELVHPEDRHMMRDSVDACVRDGSGTCEYRVVRTDGTERLLAVSGVSVLGEAGARHLRGAVHDVTQQRAADQARFEAVSLFEQGFDASPIGMFLNAADGGFIRVNDALCVLLDRPREELLAMTVQEVTHPDDRDDDDAARGAIVDGTAPNYQAERRYLRPDGSVAWVALHVGAVRQGAGAELTFFAQAVDVTERKARDSRQRSDANDAVWLGRVRDALDQSRLELYSQPIIDLSTGTTVNRELLLRMRSEDGSIVAPQAFLRVAERYGLISEIDRWVIRQAAAIAAGGAPTQFNLSGASIGSADVLAEIESAIEDTGVDPALLTIEVTETAMMEQVDAGRAFAERVIGLGCHIALDDFGTGWAGLSYLKHLPAQQLKIDMEFVRDVTTNSSDERLVRGIVGLAREFGLVTTAEGIEDESTLVKLRELGVDRGQGYLFGSPQPIDGAPAPTPGAAGEPTLASPASSAPVEVVRAVFAAIGRRDQAAVLELFDPGATVRTYATAALAKRTAPYQGHDGIRDYVDDVSRVWDNLVFSPTAFHQASDMVIVFGTVSSTLDGRTTTADVLWVWKVRGDLITSVEAFPNAHVS